MARITNYPDKHTFAYAELWSRDPFLAATWYGAVLPSEDKNDEWKMGATFKVDVIGPCFVVWEGTLPTGARALRLVNATGGLDNPPGEAFLPLYPGVNLIEFGDQPEPPAPGPVPEPEPPEPAPEPEPVPEPVPVPPVTRVPRTITVYPDRRDNPLMLWWGDDLVVCVPPEWYAEAWAGPRQLLERIRESE